jgi:hydroxyethylthiazole kinase-like uncharacterized protein yjeF
MLGKYLTVNEMTAVELNSAYLGVSTQMLMENAGASVAKEAMKRFEKGSKIAVISGLSGNGGDGFVAARHLASAGYDVETIILGDPVSITHPNTKENYRVLQNLKESIKVTVIKDSSQIQPIKADVVIDALIGTSMHGTLRPPYLQMVQAINSSNAFKVSVDIPTGMVADTGDVQGECVKADLTVTFHKPKIGYKKKPKNVGELVIAPIGIPLEAELFTGPGDVWMVHPKRDPESHKGMFGTVLVVGGSDTYSGAPTLTSMGAYATGVDLVYTAIPETAASAVMGFSPSLITIKLKGERLRKSNLSQLDPFLEKVNVLAVGPGLGQAEETVEAFNELYLNAQRHNLPMVIDADGLKAYAQKRIKVKTPTVFTPHSREFEILTGTKVEGDFKAKGSTVQTEAKKLDAVILLKGMVDVVSDGATTRYNWTGNPGMTVGGTGDVLTGLIAGFMAMGATPLEAAAAAAYVNGSAGDRVYNRKGYHLLPEDLIKEVPYVIEDSIKG